MRRAAKVDANHEEVVDYLRSKGWSVHSTASLGHGFPDLIVSIRPDFTALVEVKDGSKPPSARALTPDQVRFRENWLGLVIVATSGEDAHKKLELFS